MILFSADFHLSRSINFRTKISSEKFMFLQSRKFPNEKVKKLHKNGQLNCCCKILFELINITTKLIDKH
jgi:hypothetical protein